MHGECRRHTVIELVVLVRKLIRRTRGRPSGRLRHRLGGSGGRQLGGGLRCGAGMRRVQRRRGLGRRLLLAILVVPVAICMLARAQQVAHQQLIAASEVSQRHLNYQTVFAVRRLPKASPADAESFVHEPILHCYMKCGRW